MAMYAGNAKILFEIDSLFAYIGGSRGRAQRTPPKDPDSFVSTYKIFET